MGPVNRHRDVKRCCLGVTRTGKLASTKTPLQIKVFFFSTFTLWDCWSKRLKILKTGFSNNIPQWQHRKAAESLRFQASQIQFKIYPIDSMWCTRWHRCWRKIKFVLQEIIIRFYKKVLAVLLDKLENSPALVHISKVLLQQLKSRETWSEASTHTRPWHVALYK